MRTLGALALLAGCSAANAAASVSAPEPNKIVVSWQHHHEKLSYVGITTLYSCPGLEGQVRRILSYLGARDDLKVTAGGCPFASDAPSHNAWVDVDFSVPQPTNDRTVANETMAQWMTVELTPRSPPFMSRGDCELMESMKEVIVKDFMLRKVTYTTRCVPGELTDDGFVVRAEALKVLAPVDH